MVSVLAYTVLHYGSPYIGYAIAAAAPLVDEFLVVYCAHPSFGTDNHAALPAGESESDLRNAASQFVPESKITWQSGRWYSECDQRSVAIQHAKKRGHDLILALDYDEVWEAGPLAHAIGQANTDTQHMLFRTPMIHFWRGFGRVCRDSSCPVRLQKLTGSGEGYVGPNPAPCHFGYAIPDALMRYKWSCHGHVAELRQDWLSKVWAAKSVTDVHPGNVNFWNAEPFDRTTLPAIMHQHPYFGLDWI